MKKILMFPTCVFLCFCSIISAQQRLSEKGFSDQYRSENNLGDYAFGYNEDHTSGGSFRRETGDHNGNKMGSYGLRIADGRMRVVNYVADHNGYRASVISNEPGMSNQNSNGYLGVVKENVYGVLIPGFRYSSKPPHVTFDSGHVELVSEAHSEQLQDINPLSKGEAAPNYAVASAYVSTSQNSFKELKQNPSYVDQIGDLTSTTTSNAKETEIKIEAAVEESA